MFAAEAMGFPLKRTIKTLIVDLGQKDYIIVLMPGDKKINLKRLAEAFSVKRAAMADMATAERLTGYLVGGISPFGTKQDLTVVMEAGLLEFDKVAVNAGRRGIMLIMDPKGYITGGKWKCLRSHTKLSDFFKLKDEAITWSFFPSKY